MEPLTPTKTSLIADLVNLINENLAELLHEAMCTCPDCGGRGTVGGEAQSGGAVFDDGTLATCATCGGVGAITRYTLDMAKLKLPRYGRHVEGFEYKQGQYVPKFRSKDKAFAVLVKMLGFDKAVVEIANGATFAEAIPKAQRDAYVEQLKEMAAMGLLDRA